MEIVVCRVMIDVQCTRSSSYPFNKHSLIFIGQQGR